MIILNDGSVHNDGDVVVIDGVQYLVCPNPRTFDCSGCAGYWGGMTNMADLCSHVALCGKHVLKDINKIVEEL